MMCTHQTKYFRPIMGVIAPNLNYNKGIDQVGFTYQGFSRVQNNHFHRSEWYKIYTAVESGILVDIPI